MENKKLFAEFITQKRKEANMTQKELAGKLFVTDTTVSKWERGLSYPDITLIIKICRELNISEHEFFTACDDISAKEEKKQAKSYRTAKKTYQWIMYISYAIAIVTCFICNLAVDGTLSWFFVVLASIATAFCMTNLPLLLRKHKTIISALGVTIGTYLLLFVCHLNWGGGWLLNLAYPIATLGFAACWLILLTVKYVKLNRFYKMSIISAVLAATVPVINSLQDSVADLIYLKDNFSAYFNWTNWDVNSNIFSNKIVVLCLVALVAVGLVAGTVRAIAKKARKSRTA